MGDEEKERDQEMPMEAEVPGVEERENARYSEFQDRYLRLVAEFDNFRKRTERDMAEHRRRASDQILLALLEVVDNMDRALEATEACEPADLLEGMQAIRAQMGAILSREGIEAIASEGRPFDPFEMEAVLRMASPDVKEGGVIRELQRGYRGQGYVLRPSKVIVSSGPERQEAGPSEPPGAEGDGPGTSNVNVKIRR